MQLEFASWPSGDDKVAEFLHAANISQMIMFLYIIITIVITRFRANRDMAALGSQPSAFLTVIRHHRQCPFLLSSLPLLFTLLSAHMI